jgi:putative membrane protein
LRSAQPSAQRRIVALMPRFVLTLITNCIGLAIAAALIGPLGYGGKFGTLVLAGVVLGIINFALRPIVILLTLPAVILSLGFFLLLVNALMLWVTSRFVTGLHIGGFWSTVGGALVMWVVNMALRPWVGLSRKDKRRRSTRRAETSREERW